VDDDPDFAALYRELLEKQGLQVTVAQTVEAATRALEQSGVSLDVVLLDQKLKGPGGPDSGLELIGRVSALAPFAKTIVVTGYATPEAIERAFQLGVYDYLVKNGAFEALLRAKVRNAIEVTSERRLATVSAQAAAAQLKSAWEAARSETERNRKGARLEDLVRLLFRATPGFDRVQTRLRTESEEIDITVENRSNEVPWRNDGAYLIGECKNWSSRCGPAEIRVFQDKMRTKSGRVRTGFFIAPGGFTQGVRTTLAQHKLEEFLVVLLDAEDVQRWVDADGEAARLAVLGALYQGAVFG